MSSLDRIMLDASDSILGLLKIYNVPLQTSSPI
jgi:hypothetical protein